VNIVVEILTCHASGRHLKLFKTIMTNSNVHIHDPGIEMEKWPTWKGSELRDMMANIGTSAGEDASGEMFTNHLTRSYA
jgi:hypothetical protein